jgi:hypothetical protein
MKTWRNIFFILFIFLPILAQADAKEGLLTPLTLEVLAPPVPVKGSDGAYHLIYELQVTNATPLEWTVDRLEVRAEENKKPLASWSGESLKKIMGLLGTREGADALGAAQSAVVWIPLSFSTERDIPQKLFHHLTLSSGEKRAEESGGAMTVAKETFIAIDPPLRGEKWIAADGCCESIRHVRALLPIGGQFYTAQRFAIDWEQMGPKDTIYEGDPKKPESYFCYGKEIHAVADGKVIFAADGMPNQIPGNLPEGLQAEQADGNHVIQELSPGHYALYAHMQPGSVRVKTGDVVKAGQVLGLVGNSGNTSAPHLHFHVMDRPSALGSNGLPYVLSGFDLVGRTPGTEAFDKAEAEGAPVKILPVKNPGPHQNELPLDQNVVSFGSSRSEPL